MEPDSFFLDPTKLFEFPFILMERIGTFVILIFEQSFAFATEIGRIAVGA